MLDNIEVYLGVNLAEVWDLRYRILRKPQGLPEGSERFPEDDDPATLHFGIVADQGLVCCGSFICAPFNNMPAYQLRGMAADPSGRGYGEMLIAEAANTIARTTDARYLWCNARDTDLATERRFPGHRSAVPFYRKCGWGDNGIKKMFHNIPHLEMWIRIYRGL